MSKLSLTTDEARLMLVHVACQMIARTDELTHADQATGDGDHGIAMARGFEAVRDQLGSHTYQDLGALLKAVGMTLISQAGGASGAVFGTLFVGGSRNLADKSTFDSGSLASFLGDGMQAVQERGKARPGDKTMVDALAPAAQCSQEMAAAPLEKASLPLRRLPAGVRRQPERWWLVSARQKHWASDHGIILILERFRLPSFSRPWRSLLSTPGEMEHPLAR